MKKNRLMLNNEWESVFCGLPDEQAGQLIKAVYAAHNGKTTHFDDPVLSAVFRMMEVVVIQNRESYEATCRKNAANGSKGGRAKADANTEKRPLATATETKQTLAKDGERVANLANRKERNIKEINEIKEKEVKEKENLMPIVKQVVDYLNEKAGTKYRAYSKATADLVKARLNEKYTVDDFKTVIDNMTAKWLGDTKMESYLRPETLFNRSHFESYLNTRAKPRNKFQNFPVNEDNRDLTRQIMALQ